MADNQRVLFGAEFDVSQVVENARQVTDVFRGLQGTQKTLSEASTAYKLTLKQVADQIVQTELSIRNLDKSSKTYDKDLTDLNKDLKEMKNQQSDTIKSLEDNDKLLQATTKTLDGYAKGTRDATKAVSDLGKEHLTAREHVGYLHKELDEVFNRQVRTAIRGVGEALIGGFIGVIIGQALPSMSKLIEKVQEWILYQGYAGEKQKTMIELSQEAAKSSANEVAKLELMKTKLDDLSIPQKERITVAKAYNEIADKQNQIDLTQIDNLGVINTKIQDQINLLQERALAVAAQKQLVGAADKFLNAELDITLHARDNKLTVDELKKQVDDLFNLQKVIDSKIKEQTKAGGRQQIKTISQEVPTVNASGIVNPIESRQLLLNDNNIFGVGVDPKLFPQKEQVANLIKKLGLDPNKNIFVFRDEVKKALENASADLSKYIVGAGFSTGKETKVPKVPDNLFDKMFADLQSKLAAATESEFQSEPLIRDKFSKELDKEFLQITQLIKKKKLTPEQGVILEDLEVKVNDVLLSKSLDEFRKKHQAALDKIDSIIAENNDKHAKNRVEAIRNEFDREKAAIENNYTTAAQSLAKGLDKLVDETLKDKTLTVEEKNTRIGSLGVVFTKLIGDLDQTKINAQLDLAFKIFQDGIKELQQRLANEDLGINTESAAKVNQLSQAFLAGSITYKKYQQELTKTLKEEKEKRDQIRLDELHQEERRIEEQLRVTENAGDNENAKKLDTQLTSVRNTITTIRQGQSTSDADDLEKTKQARLKSFLEYVKGVQEIVNAAASFWQQLNEVEQKSIERSLALQEVRVSRAQRIADKGNAEYLEMELKRQDELLRKKDEAARKELAINQALTLSNATVAAISAIAKASEEGGFLSIAAATAATIGAIAAAFAFVNSLKPVVPSFALGVEQVTGNGAPAGKDKIPANLDLNERVISAPDNRNYWDVLHAVHTHQVPPQVLNTFVKNYNKFPGHKSAEIPIVNYSRLEQATNGKMGYDNAELLNKVDRLNDTMGSVVKGLHSLGLNVSLDERGLTASIEKVRKGETLRRKA